MTNLAVGLLTAATSGCWAAGWLVPMRSSRKHLLRFFGDLCIAFVAVIGIVQGHPGPLSFFNLIGGLGLAAWDFHLYRKHRDDDDWGKRLKSWAKSHIPKPSIVVLRPMGSPA